MVPCGRSALAGISHQEIPASTRPPRKRGQSLNPESSSVRVPGSVTDAGEEHSQGPRTIRILLPARGRGYGPWSRPSAECIVIGG